MMTTTSLVKRSNKNPFESSDLKLVVDNTYKRIPLGEASLDRTQRYPKIHEFTLFVDVISGDPDLIERVLFDMGPSFQPQVFTCTCPIYIRQSHTGKLAYRFATTQTVYGAPQATITIRGCGGRKLVVTHQIRLKDLNRFANEGYTSEVYRFEEFRPMPLKMIKIDEEQNFGIELELSSPPWIDRSTIADLMPRNAGQIFLPDTYSEGRGTHNDGWKIVLDGSIECNRNMPLCNKFEIVSRILKGGKGLSEIASVIRSLERTELKVNKSMGFHVHIDVSEYDINELVKICQNFIKYEDVMDSFMPPSRRTGSPECDRYFKSNRTSVQPEGATNRQLHTALNHCYSLSSLAALMNREGRYYKLNLQNLVTGRQPTIEFRQHSATMSYDKINAWVRFCIQFVQMSAKLKAPTPFREDRDLNFQFDALFQYVIKDRSLRDFYSRRQEDVGGICCTSCACGDSCAETR